MSTLLCHSESGLSQKHEMKAANFSTKHTIKYVRKYVNT